MKRDFKYWIAMLLNLSGILVCGQAGWFLAIKNYLLVTLCLMVGASMLVTGELMFKRMK